MPTPPHATVGLVTCAALPGGDEDADLLTEACRRHGLDARWVVWDDPGVDWAAFDLTVIRATWDYPPRREEFLAWAESVPRLANPAGVVRWNTDKTYLRELSEAGLPVVPTGWLYPGSGEVALPGDGGGDYVVKPSVGAGSIEAARYGPGMAEAARAHARRLLDAGSTVMVQPYLAGIDEVGESALCYVNGEYSHAVRKEALLEPDGQPLRDGLYKEEVVVAHQATPDELETAGKVLAALPAADRLLYVRVDLVPDGAGRPVVLEVELVEPSLFLAHAVAGTADRLAAGIARYAARLP